MSYLDLMGEIEDEAPRVELGGETYYLVEGCIRLKPSELEEYARQKTGQAPKNPTQALERLIAATIDGKPIRWAKGTVLSWALAENFHDDPATCKDASALCIKAGEDWNRVAKARGLDIRFCEKRLDAEEPPLFEVRYTIFEDEPNLYAHAFFPHSPKASRVVDLCPPTFKPESPFDAVGVLRHEFGHILGFRHEHLGIAESWDLGKMGGQRLTDYDSVSCMHYPIKGLGTNDFKITEADEEGFATLYSMSNEDSEWYSP